MPIKTISNIEFPEWLYHGTTLNHLSSFRSILVNWDILKKSPKRDFGIGFYTTIDLKQAKEWALKRGEETFEEPCVLQIKSVITPYFETLYNEIKHHIFLGSSLDWAKYILEHRTMTTSEFDPCSSTKEHFHIITGPMADNDTGDVLARYQKGDKDLEWFYNEIKKDKKSGYFRNELGLGNQIVFCNPGIANGILVLDGFYKLNSEGEWEYYGL